MIRLSVQEWLNNGSWWKECENVLPPYPPSGNIVVGSVSFIEEQNLFQIMVGGDYSGTYDIDADRLLVAKDFTDWIWHLHSKDWITGQHLKDFMDCVCCWIHRDHGQSPQIFYDVAGGHTGGMDKA